MNSYKEFALLKKKQVTFGIILPYIWIFIFLCLIFISLISSKINYVISVENLILLTYIFSPLIYIAGLFISVITMLKSGLSKNVLFAIGLNAALLFVWFIFQKSMFIEFNMIS